MMWLIVDGIDLLVSIAIFALGVKLGLWLALRRVEDEAERWYRQQPGAHELQLWGGSVNGLRQAARLLGSRKYK